MHAIVTFGSLLYGIQGSPRFDGIEAPHDSVAAGKAALFLMSPGAMLWTKWASAHLPTAVEWIVFLGDSVLWGLFFSTIVEMGRRIRGGRTHSPAGA
jgi:hypothetical protein